MDLEISKSTSSPGESDLRPELQRPDPPELFRSCPIGCESSVQQRPEHPELYRSRPRGCEKSGLISISEVEEDAVDDTHLPELQRPDPPELFRSCPIGCEMSVSIPPSEVEEDAVDENDLPELQRPDPPELNAPHPIGRGRLNSISSTISCESFRSDQSEDKPLNFRRRDLLPRWGDAVRRFVSSVSKKNMEA